jgi:GNAT superfamily N-acetyltransferase
MRRTQLRVEPLTPERWDDFVKLFGARGACGGCWCMTPRLTSAEYEKKKGAANRRAMKRLVDSGRVTGLLGYLGDDAVAWCSIEPRSELVRLASSRVLKPVDDRPVWSIVCFFIDRTARGRGLSVEMIRAAVNHARAHGARIVEGYPVDPGGESYPATFAWTGLVSAFERAGFREVARRSPKRPIMRRAVRPTGSPAC